MSVFLCLTLGPDGLPRTRTTSPVRHWESGLLRRADSAGVECPGPGRSSTALLHQPAGRCRRRWRSFSRPAYPDPTSPPRPLRPTPHPPPSPAAAPPPQAVIGRMESGAATLRAIAAGAGPARIARCGTLPPE